MLRILYHWRLATTAGRVCVTMSTEPTDDPTPSIALETKVDFLNQPESYPEQPHRVETLETHTSWIFLTDAFAYKLKKPLCYEFLDFSTVDARRRNCEAEVQLNRRLAHDVYLGTVPLTVQPHDAAAMHLGSNGKVVDWLVKMRRLPSHWVLEQKIKNHTVKANDIAKVAMVLADFYEKAPPVAISPAEYHNRFVTDVCVTLNELTGPDYELSTTWIKVITDAQLQFLQNQAAFFTRRVQEGRIIEAHGDLRPEHIYLGNEPIIVDCLEFNREFRILDSVDELAFLAMECERLAAPDIGNILFATYRQITSDNPPHALTHFYMSYRAMLWAKLAIRHINRHGTGKRSKWISRTEDYLHLAENHIEQSRCH